MTLPIHRQSRTMPLMALLVLLVPAVAGAAPMTWEFTGTTTSTSTALSEYFAPAQPVVFSLTFDPTHPELTGSSSGTGLYRFDGESRDYFNFEAQIGDKHYQWSQQAAFLNVDPNNTTLILDTSITGIGVQGSVLGTTTLWHPVALDFALSWVGSGTLSSNALPSMLPDSDFRAGFQLGFAPGCDPLADGGCPSAAQVNVDLTSARAVPAPPTVLLVGLGLVAGALFRRRRAR